jgi:PAS domain S-box-containing protein
MDSVIQFKEILDSLASGVVIVDSEYRYIYRNEASLAQGMYPDKGFLGKTISKTDPTLLRNELFEQIFSCMKKRCAHRMDYEHKNEQGVSVWYELNIQPALEGLIIFSADVTERKNAEEEDRKEEFLTQFADQMGEFKEKNEQSLRYAKRLQQALMQEKKDLNELFPTAFILLKPKHIVSGDFYWFKHNGDKVLLAACDCTGHGVPGSLLTIMGLNILHAAFNTHKIDSPPKLLKYLDEDLNRKLSHKTTGKAINDGMDITICEIDRVNRTLSVSGANNPVYLVHNGTLHLIKTDKYSIGNGETGKQFSMQQVPVCTGDWIYLFSDGFLDQFGGPFGKKFGSVRFRELLCTISKAEPGKQESLLRSELLSWRAKEEQTDDVLIIGVRID